jgi:hypothetical protein
MAKKSDAAASLNLQRSTDIVAPKRGLPVKKFAGVFFPRRPSIMFLAMRDPIPECVYGL